jgi:hypothetical protein
MRTIAGATALGIMAMAATAAAQQQQLPSLPNSSPKPAANTPAHQMPNPLDPAQTYELDQPGVREAEKTGPLDAEERAALARGEYSIGQRVGGAVAAGLVGFGSGQAIQGRWRRTGWIFSAAEPAALAVGIIGLWQCPDEGCSGLSQAAALTGFLGFIGLRAWGFFDAVIAPGNHNRRLQRLRVRAGIPEYARGVTPYLLPAAHGEGATAGLTLRF